MVPSTPGKPAAIARDNPNQYLHHLFEVETQSRWTGCEPGTRFHARHGLLKLLIETPPVPILDGLFLHSGEHNSLNEETLGNNEQEQREDQRQQRTGLDQLRP